jgi:hypothetical protein
MVCPDLKRETFTKTGIDTSTPYDYKEEHTFTFAPCVGRECPHHRMNGQNEYCHKYDPNINRS